MVSDYIKIDKQIINVKEIRTINNPCEWGVIRAYEIIINSTYDNIKEIFKDDIKWVIVHQYEEYEEDCSSLKVADRYIDYRDGTVSVIMREQTALEEAYELLYGGE